MKRWLASLSYGIGGLVVAVGLSLGTFALAGHQIGAVAGPLQPVIMNPSTAPSEEKPGVPEKPISLPKVKPISGSGSGSRSGSGWASRSPSPSHSVGSYSPPPPSASGDGGGDD